MGVNECALLGRQMRDKERRQEEYRGRTQGLIYLASYYWDRSFPDGEGADKKQSKTWGVGGSRGNTNMFRKQKCITVNVSKKMSRELTGRAGGQEEGQSERVTETSEKKETVCKKAPPCDAQLKETREKAPFISLSTADVSFSACVC